MQVLVLASGSPYRSQLLRRLGLPFEQCAPDVDETPMPGEPPATLANRLAHSKAHADQVINQAIRSGPDSIIIASDQVACLNEQLLGKPGTIQQAIGQLCSMSGQNVTFHTSLCIRHLGNPTPFTYIDSTTAQLRALSSAEIKRYLAVDNPLDCAGSFKMESLGISLFESINSTDPTALIGLPLIAVCRGLRSFGLELP